MIRCLRKGVESLATTLPRSVFSDVNGKRDQNDGRTQPNLRPHRTFGLLGPSVYSDLRSTRTFGLLGMTDGELDGRCIRKGPHGLGITLTLLVPDLEKVKRSRKPGLRFCWNQWMSSMGIGSSCLSTPMGTSEKSRRRSSKSALMK
jgi:hypothetical protein